MRQTATIVYLFSLASVATALVGQKMSQAIPFLARPKVLDEVSILVQLW